MDINGKTKIYAGITNDQESVKMDTYIAKALFEYYNKYVDLMKERN